MPTSQGSGEMQTSNSTKDDGTYETNDGFISDVNKNYNNIDLHESTKQDEMALKTTVVSVLGNGAGITEKKPRRSCTWSRRTCVFVGVLAFLLLVAFIAVLFLYIQEVDGSESSGLFYNVCLKDSCISRSAAILGYMNRSVDPCEDFNSFACGGWQAKTFIPTSETSVHTIWAVTNANKQFMRNLLADPATKTKYSSNRAVTKAIDYYQTCLSKATINAQGDSYLKEAILVLGGCNLTSTNWNSSQYDVEKAILTAFVKFGVQPFFAVSVLADFVNSSRRRFAISDGGIRLASTYYVETNSTQDFYEKTRLSYRQYMIDVMVLFGADRKKAEEQMERVYLLEKDIAMAFRENAGRPHTSTVGQLTNFTGFDWHSFLNGITATQNFTLSKDEGVLVRTRNVMKAVGTLIRNTDKAIISNYIAWVTLEDVIRHLPDEYSDARLAYQKRIHGDAFDDSERWDFCYEDTKNAFPFSIGLMFVDEKLGPQARERAKEIFEEIRSEFLLELDDQTWMDDATRAEAREKAKASRILVGYPDFIKDEQLLNDEYRAIQVNRSEYLKTVFSVKNFGFLKLVADYKKPVDRNRFAHSPVDTNAYHYRSENKNVFLAGILRTPFYDEGNLRASNYGGIGMVAGHELTHGFDINGRVHDKDGNLRNWWTRNSSNAFITKSGCFVHQYGEFEMFGKKINGQQTLGENTADNGGLKFAYEAYKRWVSKNGEEPKLPGLDYTPYQLFFISYAQGWCSKYTLQGAFHQIDNFPWPPMNIRVQGVIMNSEGFAEAFHCPRGSRMNPEKKCSVW